MRKDVFMNQIPFVLLDETASTNTWMKETARKGEIEPPYLCIAQRQTAGRGRLGRSFLSPEGGLYMTLLLRQQQRKTPVTIDAAVAVADAIEEATGIRVQIKWVNDLFYRGKKVCGILAEGWNDLIALGIGVNLISPPEGFIDVPIAGALDVKVDPVMLAFSISQKMLNLQADELVLESYKKRMPLFGHLVSYRMNGETHSGIVEEMDAEGALLVRQGDELVRLRTGEVSLGSAQVAEIFSAGSLE